MMVEQRHDEYAVEEVAPEVAARPGAAKLSSVGASGISFGGISSTNACGLSAVETMNANGRSITSPNGDGERDGDAVGRPPAPVDDGHASPSRRANRSSTTLTAPMTAASRNESAAP